MRQLPREAVRDLLGIARAMYAAKKAEMAPAPVLNELKAIGEKLKLALEMGHLTDETLGGKAAIKHAEEACDRLTRLISIETKLAPTLEAAAIRVRRQGPAPLSKSDARKTGGRGRH